MCKDSCPLCRQHDALGQLQVEYNVAVANGLYLKARRISREMRTVARSL